VVNCNFWRDGRKFQQRQYRSSMNFDFVWKFPAKIWKFPIKILDFRLKFSEIQLRLGEKHDCRFNQISPKRQYISKCQTTRLFWHPLQHADYHGPLLLTLPIWFLDDTTNIFSMIRIVHIAEVNMQVSKDTDGYKRPNLCQPGLKK